MPVSEHPHDGPEFSPPLNLMRLNFEYMLAICPERRLTENVKARLDEIEREVISIFWRTSPDVKKDMVGLFRAFIAMRNSYRTSLTP